MGLGQIVAKADPRFGEFLCKKFYSFYNALGRFVINIGSRDTACQSIQLIFAVGIVFREKAAE